MHIVIIGPGAKLQVLLGMPSHVQGESKRLRQVSVCCLSYSHLVGWACKGKQVLTCTCSRSRACIASAPVNVDLISSAGLPASTLVPPFLDSTKFLCNHSELQPLIENLVRNFNLVGVVMSCVILIY